MARLTGDFAPVDMEKGWETPPGYVAAMKRKMLQGALDDANRRGRRTSLIRIPPGTRSAGAHDHENVEEALILEGDMTWIRDDGSTVQRLGPMSYVCRPPRRMHGPFVSRNGAMVLEVWYYDPDSPKGLVSNLKDAEVGDFVDLDMATGWETPPGYEPGISRKVLAGTLDEKKKRGRRTSLMRYAPGARVPRVVRHDFVEEVLVLKGELLWTGATDAEVVQRIGPLWYVCRRPGVAHGPFVSPGGCTLVEVCYYPGW
ncbi:MAG: cupin domain-containing protein [Proteobacteria bacterium]|nr:cupin domain-containing protein [Pseudomonadota bacterium]